MSSQWSRSALVHTLRERVAITWRSSRDRNAKRPTISAHARSAAEEAMADPEPTHWLTELREGRGFIDSGSDAKEIWDFMLILLVVYNAAFIPYSVAVEPDSRVIEVLDSLSDVLFALDMAATFVSSVEMSMGEVSFQLKDIAHVYLRGWFFVDLLATLPMDIMASGAGSSVGLVQLLKCFRLLRLGRIMRKLDRFASARALRIVNLIVFFFMVAHWMGCAFFYLARTSADESRAWYAGAWWHEDRNAVTEYSVLLYWSLTTLSTVGYGDFTPNTTPEMSFAIFTMVLGAVVTATTFGNVTALMENFDKGDRQYTDRVVAVKEYFDLHSLPEALMDKTVDYVDVMEFINGMADIRSVLVELPEWLRGEIMVQLHGPLLRRVPLFCNVTSQFIRALSTQLYPQVCLKDDTILSKGDVARCMYFLQKGVVSVVIGGAKLAMAPGTFFGEGACLSHGRRSADVVAETFCFLYLLTAAAFDSVMDDFPEFRSQIEDMAETRWRVTMYKLQAQQAQQQAEAEAEAGPAGEPKPLSALQQAGQDFGMNPDHLRLLVRIIQLHWRFWAAKRRAQARGESTFKDQFAFAMKLSSLRSKRHQYMAVNEFGLSATRRKGQTKRKFSQGETQDDFAVMDSFGDRLVSMEASHAKVEAALQDVSSKLTVILALVAANPGRVRELGL